MTDLIRRLIRGSGTSSSTLDSILTDLVLVHRRLDATQAVAINRAVKLVIGMRDNRDVQNYVGLAYIRELETLNEPVQPDWLYHQAS